MVANETRGFSRLGVSEVKAIFKGDFQDGFSKGVFLSGYSFPAKYPKCCFAFENDFMQT